jgi:hypothetical protein
MFLQKNNLKIVKLTSPALSENMLFYSPFSDEKHYQRKHYTFVLLYFC